MIHYTSTHMYTLLPIVHTYPCNSVRSLHLHLVVLDIVKLHTFSQCSNGNWVTEWASSVAVDNSYLKTVGSIGNQ